MLPRVDLAPRYAPPGTVRPYYLGMGALSALRSARFTRPLIGSPISSADCLIGSPISSQSTGRTVKVAMRGDDRVCRQAREALQAVDVLREAARQETLLVQQPHEKVRVRRPEAAGKQLLRPKSGGS